MILDDERLDEVNDSIKLIQKKNGLTYGTDAYLLYAYLKKRPNATAADLGAGTGIISLLALSRDKIKTVHAIEVQESFSDLISRNASLNNMSNRLLVHCQNVCDLKSYDLGGEVDVVFSNPPYMTVTSGFHNEHGEKFIARHEALGTIEDFCQAANRILKFGGSFYLVYRTDRLCDLVSALRASGLEPKRMTVVYNRENQAPTLLLLEAKKGAAPGLFVTKPLILANSDGAMTKELSDIYENGVFNEQYERP